MKKFYYFSRGLVLSFLSSAKDLSFVTNATPIAALCAVRAQKEGFYKPKINTLFSVFLFVALFFSMSTEAQLSSLYTYSYTGTNGNSYNATPTILQSSGTVGTDAVFTSQAIGFTFQFGCNTYTTCGISANGFIWFGTGTCSATQYTPLSSTVGETGSVDGIISAFGANLASHATGASPARTLNTKLSGTAPNQVFTIEWRKAVMSGAASNPVDIQIKLFQTSNKVEIRLYDLTYGLSGASAVGQIGMRTTVTNFVNRTTAGVNLCTTTAGTLNTQTCSIVPTTSCNYATSATSQAITYNYALTGSCCTPPTSQASIGAFSGLSTSGVTVNWTNGTGVARVVVAHQTTAVSANPANGTDYTATANSAFGSGANLGSSNFVVYQGTGTSVNVTGLTAGQTYYFSVFEYVTSPSICYLTPGSSTSQVIPLCFPPTIASSGMSFSSVLTTSNDVNWVRGNGDAGVIVVARLTSTAAVAPVSGTTYTTTSFGSGSGNQLTGAGNYVVYVGTGTSVNVSNLMPSTNYTYSVYEYMISGTCYGSASIANQTTASCSPAIDATAAVFSNVLGTNLTLSFTRGSGSHVLVVCRTTATSNVNPVYNTSYTANAAYGSGSTTGTGNFVVYNGTGNTVSVTGLAQFTSYTFVVYEYNSSPNCYSITPLSSSVSTLNTTASGLALSCAYTGTSQALTLSTITATAGKVLVATGAIDDGNYPNQNITSMSNGSGFLFSYLGNDYSSFGINANGFIWFGSGQPGATYPSFGGTPVGSASANLGGSGTINGIISAAGADLISHYHIYELPNTSQINVVVTGTSPNRVVTIEWTGFQAKSIGANSTCYSLISEMDDSRLDFQIKLYEKGGTNSNRIEMVYRDQGPFCVYDSYNFQVGLRGASNADFATRGNSGSMTSSSTSNGISATITIGLASSTFINGNVGVRYQPNLSVPTISGALSNTCPAVTTTLTSSSATNNQWFLNGSVIPGPGSNTQSYVATQSGSYTVTVNASGCYGQSAPSVVSVIACAVDVHASAGSGGSIAPSGTIAVPFSTNQLFTFTPACGYAVADVIVDGISQGAIPNYTFTNVTVIHSISVSFMAITETCNGIDDDCNGFTDEGCSPNFYGDSPGTAPNVIYSSNTAYPNCYPITGDNTNAGNSPESIFSGPDSWYAFIAQSNGVTISMYGASMDNAIALYHKTGSAYILEDSENINPSGVGGFERLTYSSLVPGTTYYVSAGAASGNIGGPFTVCIQHLMPSGCAYPIPVGGFALCDNFKAIYRGAAGNGVSYNFNFNGVGGGASGLTSSNGTNGLIPLSGTSLGLRYGGVYNVSVDVAYALQNGAGTTETILINGNVASANCFGVNISPQPLIEVKTTQRCPSTLLRSNYLIGTPVAGNPNACSAISYTYEFTQITSCSNLTPISAFPITFTTNGNTPYLQLANLPYLANQGAWSVRIRPNFSYGFGNYGPAQVITVNNTSAIATLSNSFIHNDNEKNYEQDVLSAVYPNPNNGTMVNINLVGLNDDQLSMKAMDALGRVVFNKSFAVDDSFNRVVVFDQPLTPGIYVFEFRCGDQVQLEKMIVE